MALVFAAPRDARCVSCGEWHRTMVGRTLCADCEREEMKLESAQSSAWDEAEENDEVEKKND